MINQEEKIGGQASTEIDGRPLQEFLFQTGSFDLGCSGVFHTWCNG